MRQLIERALREDEASWLGQAKALIACHGFAVESKSGIFVPHGDTVKTLALAAHNHYLVDFGCTTRLVALVVAEIDGFSWLSWAGSVAQTACDELALEGRVAA